MDTEGASISVSLGAPLPESTTVAVLLTTGIRDRKREGRQNDMSEPYRWIFSTGDSLWPGALQGKVTRVGAESEGIVLVGLYPGEGDTVPDPAVLAPAAITQARRDGTYLLDGLPVDGRPWRLVTMFDRDGNREIRGAGEFVSARTDTLRLVPPQVTRTLDVELVDPAAPGEVQGTLQRAPGDSVDVWLEFLADTPETSLTPSARARVGAGGTFSVRRVAPGSYRVRAFCDTNLDGTRGEGEAPRDLLHVVVPPGETVDVGAREFAPCPPGEAKP